MSQIKNLTKKQWEYLPKFKKEWLTHVLSPVDDSVIREKTKKMFELLNIKKSPILILDNPILIAMGILMFHSQLRNQLYSQLTSQLDVQLRNILRNQLNNQLDSQLQSQLRNQLYGQLYNQLNGQLNSQLNNQLRSQLNSKLYGQLNSQLDVQFRSQLRNQLYSWHVGVGWSSNAGYYKFANFIGVKFNTEVMNICSDFVSHVIVCFPFENMIFCSRKPITRWKNRLLHSDSKPAIEFLGGWNIWCLNGVNVTKEIVTTPAEKLDPRLVTTEKNAEVRREIVRKIGIERVCQKLNAKVLEKKDNYELLNLDLGDRFRPYLKMINPSIGTYHIEGVHTDCKTIEQALNWRNKTSEQPTVIT